MLLVNSRYFHTGARIAYWLKKEATGLMTGELGFDFRQEQKSSLFFKISRLALGPPSPFLKLYPQLFIREQSGWGVKLAHHPNLLRRSTT